MSRATKIFLLEIILVILICSYNNMILLAFIWVILHEIAHIVLAMSYGCRFNNLEFHLFGIRAELLELDGLNDRKKFGVYIVGAGFNLIVALMLFIISQKVESNIIMQSIGINISLAIFNLLPAYPLDGARILEILFSKKMLFRKAQKIIIIMSYSIAIIIFFIFLIMLIFLHKLNISMIIGSIIIIYITRLEEKTTMYITMGNIVKKRKKLIKNMYIENRSLSVYYKHFLVNVLGLVDRNKFNTFYVLDEEMKLLYILNEDELIRALGIYGNITLEEYKSKRV